MKVLKSSQYVSERIQLQPITNAELDKVQQEIKNMPHKLALEYENILKEGNIVFVKERGVINPVKHIVMSGEKYNAIFSKIDINCCTDDYILCTWDNYTYWECENFENCFPRHNNDSAKILKIIDAHINLKDVKSSQEMQEIYNKYEDIQ